MEVCGMSKNRKDAFYKVKFNGEWRVARWTTNPDIDSSWCCWWIQGEPIKAWGWSDEDFEEIVETPFADNELTQPL